MRRLWTQERRRGVWQACRTISGRRVVGTRGGGGTEARQVRPHRDYCSVLYSVKALSEGDSWDEVSNESVSIFLQITQLLTSGL
jgi:hypothetical protein